MGQQILVLRLIIPAFPDVASAKKFYQIPTNHKFELSTERPTSHLNYKLKWGDSLTSVVVSRNADVAIDDTTGGTFFYDTLQEIQHRAILQCGYYCASIASDGCRAVPPIFDNVVFDHVYAVTFFVASCSVHTTPPIRFVCRPPSPVNIVSDDDEHVKPDKKKHEECQHE